MSRVELVVVDNGSTDDTARVAREWLDRQEFPGRLVTEPRPGLAAARNCAIRSAAGALLLFTDDDCRLDPDYIRLAVAIDKTDDGLVLRGGRVELGDVSDTRVSVLTEKERRRWSKKARSAQSCNIGIALIGASMMMRRAVIECVGFFDERFGAGGPFRSGEEIDFVYRSYAAGVVIEYEPDLVVYHYHGRNNKEEARRLALSYCRGDGALLAKFWRQECALRPLLWDIRKALNEFRGGQLSRPDLHVSHWRRLWEMGHGFVEYRLFNLKLPQLDAQP